MENMSTEKTWCLLMVFGPPRPPYLVVSEEDGGADGVEEDAVRTPAELVAERIVWTLGSRKTSAERAVRLHLNDTVSSLSQWWINRSWQLFINNSSLWDAGFKRQSTNQQKFSVTDTFTRQLSSDGVTLTVSVWTHRLLVCQTDRYDCQEACMCSNNHYLSHTHTHTHTQSQECVLLTHSAAVSFGLVDTLHGQHVVDARVQSHLIHDGDARLLHTDTHTQTHTHTHSFSICWFQTLKITFSSDTTQTEPALLLQI